MRLLSTPTFYSFIQGKIRLLIEGGILEHWIHYWGGTEMLSCLIFRYLATEGPEHCQSCPKSHQFNFWWFLCLSSFQGDSWTQIAQIWFEALLQRISYCTKDKKDTKYYLECFHCWFAVWNQQVRYSKSDFVF